MAQADAALGVSDSGPMSTSTAGGGVVCEYTGAGGTAAATIFRASECDGVRRTGRPFGNGAGHASDLGRR